MRILVVQLTRLGEHEVAAVSRALEGCLGAEVTVIPEPRPPPMVFYDWGRMQYRSDRVLEWLGRLSHFEGLVLALGDVDAYVPGLNFVFGQADPSAGVAAVYTKRLKMGITSIDRYLERLSKEALHEVGHLLGLGHCRDKRCVMSFSNHVGEVDYKNAMFCKRCAAQLESSGLRVDCILSEG